MMLDLIFVQGMITYEQQGLIDKTARRKEVFEIQKIHFI